MTDVLISGRRSESVVQIAAVSRDGDGDDGVSFRTVVGYNGFAGK
jgi:hypothetical protein